MGTIQWQPEVNALTAPQSYRPRFVPREVFGYDDLAAEIVRDNPTWNESLVKAMMMAMTGKIKQILSNGGQVTLENGFTFRLSLTGRMEAPDDPLPTDDDLLQIKIHASRPFVDDVRHEAQFERLPAEEKLPLINAAEDTRLNLPDVLYSKGVLKLTGNNLAFDPKDPDCGCLLEGTESGRSLQEQFALISNSGILVVPEIPTQANSWNNEYTVSIIAQYTEHGTLRTGTYRRRLRAPLTVINLSHPNPPEAGILTDSASSAYVNVTGGSLTADELLRIQVILDLSDGLLRFNLLDMEENGAMGAAVTVSANGVYTLPGFPDSALSSLEIRVDMYTELLKMVRNFYSGRVVDLLDLKV